MAVESVMSFVGAFMVVGRRGRRGITVVGGSGAEPG